MAMSFRADHGLWEGMNYRVRIVPSPTVVDADGNAVANAHVLEISFPGDSVETRIGRTNVITGAGVAKIMVAGETIRGVSLC